MALVKVLRLISAVWESFLAIPMIGGMFIISWAWAPLIASFVLGFVGIIACVSERKSTAGHVLQLIAGLLGFVPVLGWLFHFVAALVLWISFVRS